MNCPSLDDIAAFEADGSNPGVADTARHVPSCPDCQARVRELQRQREALVALMAEYPPERRQGCPEWEDLAAFVERGSSGLALHVENCEFCLLQVANFRLAREKASRELPVLSKVLLPRVKKSSWLDGFGRNWWGVGFSGALVAAGIMAAVLVTRAPKNAVVAVSHTPAASPSRRQAPPQVPPVSPGLPSGTTVEAPVEIAGNQPGPERLRGEPSILNRALKGADSFLGVVFRYTSGGKSDAIALPLPEDLTLHSGDRFSLQVTPKSAVWLYVFQEDAHDAISVLFPSAGLATGVNPAGAHRRILPAEGQAYKLDEAAGVETIYLLYSPARMERCEHLVSLVESQTGDPNVKQILHELVRKAEVGGPSARGYAAIRFSFHHQP